MKAKIVSRNLHFKFTAGTSRGVLHTKPSHFLILEQDGKTGVGECSIIPGLSIDPENQLIEKLEELCFQINSGDYSADLSAFPSISFALETALLDLFKGKNKIIYETPFSAGEKGIDINGLVWMGDRDFMSRQIREKIEQGYRCIKLKIGSLDFDSELQMIEGIRKQFTHDEMEIRVDANGAFLPQDALEKLKRLSEFAIHSIEQPIRQGQWEAMAALCAQTPLPIALDEELIGYNTADAGKLIEAIQPQYIILKPSLLGGLRKSEDWIAAARKQNVGWWITSALESNIGLNAIAQWTSTLENPMPQGLGTGQLYTNNINSPLEIKEAQLWYNPEKEWDTL